jgi:preprotein translocase subunit YajC
MAACRTLLQCIFDEPTRLEGSVKMFGLRVALWPLFAQQDGGSPAILIWMLALLPAFYLLVMRPNRQQEQKRRAMIDALKKNDKVVTTGGIYGTVTSVDTASDRVVLRIDDEKGIKVVFTRASVARVIEPSAEKPAES